MVVLQIFFWFWLWNNFANRLILILIKLRRTNKLCQFLGHPVCGPWLPHLPVHSVRLLKYFKSLDQTVGFFAHFNAVFPKHLLFINYILPVSSKKLSLSSGFLLIKLRWNYFLVFFYFVAFTNTVLTSLVLMSFRSLNCFHLRRFFPRELEQINEKRPVSRAYERRAIIRKQLELSTTASGVVVRRWCGTESV